MTIMKAIFPPGIRELRVHGLYQWDRGQILEIHDDSLPAVAEVHFACVGMTEGAIVHVCNISSGVGRVAIPDKFLERTTPIIAWVYAVGETSGETVATITMPVIPRTKPKDSPEIPEAISDKYTELMDLVNEYFDEIDDSTDAAVKVVEEKLKAGIAETFDGLESSLRSDLDSMHSSFRTDMDTMHSSHTAEVEAKQSAHESEIERYIAEHAQWIPRTVYANMFDIYAADASEKPYECKSYRVWNESSTAGWGFTVTAKILTTDSRLITLAEPITLPHFTEYKKGLTLRCFGVDTSGSSGAGLLFGYSIDGEGVWISIPQYDLNDIRKVQSAWLSVSGVTNAEIYNEYGTVHSVDGVSSSDLDAVYSGEASVFIPDGLLWEQGTLWEGAPSSATNRIRTNTFTAEKGDVIMWLDSAKGQLKYAIHLFDDSGNFILDTGWMNACKPYVFDRSYKARIVCTYIRENDIAISEGKQITFKKLGQRNIDIDYLMGRKADEHLPNTLVVAHRGHTDSGKHPDNSIAAFKCAAEKGYKYIESDLYLTKDKRIVLHHDPSVTSSMGESYLIAETTLADINAVYSLSNGELIPTIEAFLTFCKEYDMTPVLELKGGLDNIETIQLLVDALKLYDLADKAFVLSFDSTNIAIAVGLYPKLNVIYLHDAYNPPDEYSIKLMPQLLKTPNNRAYIGYWSTSIFGKETMDYAKNNGWDGVYCMVADDKSQLESMLPYIVGYGTNTILPAIANGTVDLPIQRGTGENSVIICDVNTNKALWKNSIAIGEQCTAEVGIGGVASGYKAYQRATASHSLGKGTYTDRTGQLACGEWNARDSVALLVCGDGSSDGNRHTAFAVYPDRITGNGIDIHYEALGILLENLEISFTVDGKEYKAKYGMTWEDWVESDYNTDGFYTGLPWVYSKDGKYVSKYTSMMETIKHKKNYTLSE